MKYDIKLCHCFVVTLCDDGTESSKSCYDAFVSKELPMGLHYFSTILSNLALGHEIDRLILERCRVEIIKLSSY